MYNSEHEIESVKYPMMEEHRKNCELKVTKVSALKQAWTMMDLEFKYVIESFVFSISKQFAFWICKLLWKYFFIKKYQITFKAIRGGEKSKHLSSDVGRFENLGFLYFQILVGRTWPPQTLASGAPDCEQVPFVQHRTQKIDNSSHIEFSLELFDQIENKSLSKNYHTTYLHTNEEKIWIREGCQ